MVSDRGLLRDQLTAALSAAMEADGATQADLARMTGLTPKHVNHLLNGKAGSLGIYDFAAVTLKREWVVELREVDHGE